MSFIRGAAVLAIASSVLVSGCSMMPTRESRGDRDRVYAAQDSDGGGFHLFGGRRSTGPDTEAGIGVNSYLWRASLDTLSFMPLSSADPWGGIIITDWYTNPEKPDERFKATVYILDTRLRADALNVAIFKQVDTGGGQWVDSAVTSQTETDIENAILTRARQLRLANAGRG
jgi:hypothetical protein